MDIGILGIAKSGGARVYDVSDVRRAVIVFAGSPKTQNTATLSAVYANFAALVMSDMRAACSAVSETRDRWAAETSREIAEICEIYIFMRNKIRFPYVLRYITVIILFSRFSPTPPRRLAGNHGRPTHVLGRCEVLLKTHSLLVGGCFHI